MNAIGKVLLTCCLLAMTGSGALAAVTATLDRDRVSLGDTLQLTITATDKEDISSLDLRPLADEFEILQRSTRSNTSWINGKRSDTRQMLLDITPKREGTLKIPPLPLGRDQTNMLLVSVGPPPAGSASGQAVLFDAEFDRDSVYVQGQVVLTVRLQQAINLEDRSITELELDNAFVRPLEQKSFQRTVGGRPWLVHEVRYAIFPEQSGTLEIPAMTFAARESEPRRSFFDIGGGGRQVRRKTQPLSIEVLPRPDTFPAGTWLPARRLTVEESWSTPPENLRAGESTTRTVRIQAEGLQGAQLPPILFPASDGLKYYPDQPVITDAETGSGLLGSRQDSAALVPTRAGSWDIPEVRIPWWDTESGQLRYAMLPGRQINVAAADPASTVTAGVTAPAIAVEPGAAVVAPASAGNALPWQILSAVSAIGWLLTLAYLLWSRRRPATPEAAPHSNRREQQAYQQLLQACASGSPLQVRQGLVSWAAAQCPDKTVISLSQVAAVLQDEALARELDALNAALYSEAGTPWDGAALAARIRALRGQRRKAAGATGADLQLYPRAA